jgi:hypothetical protein
MLGGTWRSLLGKSIRRFVELYDEALKSVKPSEPSFVVKSVREKHESRWLFSTCKVPLSEA